MDTRGWQRERKIDARGPGGQKVPIIMGVTRDMRARWVAAIATDDGATVVLTSKLREQVARNLRVALATPNSEPAVARGHDTLGRRVDIATGHDTTPRGERVTVLAVGRPDAAAVITEQVRARLEIGMDAVLTDAAQLRRGGV